MQNFNNNWIHDSKQQWTENSDLNPDWNLDYLVISSIRGVHRRLVLLF